MAVAAQAWRRREEAVAQSRREVIHLRHAFSNAKRDVTQNPESSSADWPEPPRAFTLRGAAIVVLVLVLSTLLAILAISLRRSRTVKTLDFYGTEAVTLIQGSDHLYTWQPEADGRRPETLPNVSSLHEVTHLPGVSHLRAALLDDRHYNWEKKEAFPPDEAAAWRVFVFADDTPQRRFALRLDVASGAVRPMESTRVVFLTERVRTAVATYLAEIANASQKRAD